MSHCDDIRAQTTLVLLAQRLQLDGGTCMTSAVAETSSACKRSGSRVQEPHQAPTWWFIGFLKVVVGADLGLYS